MSKINAGLKITSTFGPNGVEANMSGPAVDNLKAEIKEETKREIIEYIEKEIVKTQDEKLRNELDKLKRAIKQNDKSLLNETIEEMIKSGASTIFSEILKKVLFGG